MNIVFITERVIKSKKLNDAIVKANEIINSESFYQIISEHDSF